MNSDERASNVRFEVDRLIADIATGEAKEAPDRSDSCASHSAKSWEEASREHKAREAIRDRQEGEAWQMIAN